MYTLKENLTFAERGAATDYIVNTVLSDGNYQPYFFEPAKLVAFALYFVPEFTFSEEDDIVEKVLNDVELNQLYVKSQKKCIFPVIALDARTIIDYKLANDNPMNEMFTEITKLVKSVESKLDGIDAKDFAADVKKIAEHITEVDFASILREVVNK